MSVQARGSVDEFRNQHFLKATSQKASWQVRLRHSKCGIFSLNLWWRAHAYYRWGCRGFFRAGHCLPPSSWTGVFLQECCKATLTSTEAFRKTVAKKTLYKTVVQSSSTRILHEMLHKCSTNHLKSRGLQGLLKVFHMTEFQGVWRGGVSAKQVQADLWMQWCFPTVPVVPHKAVAEVSKIGSL